MASLIKEIQNTLRENELTIATAESITAGLLQDALASEGGASRVFRGGITAYDIDTKEDLLGVDRNYAEKCNCVSEQTVQEMAKGARELFRSDIGIATTGYADRFRLAEPHAFYAISIKDKMFSGMIDLDHIRGRQNRREAVRDHVINVLHAELFILYPTLEIEYKFAVKPEYYEEIKAQAETVLDIKQCYLGINDNQTSRIRIVNDHEAYATSKLAGNIEIEYPVPLGKARMIYDSFVDAVGTVKKKRYIIDNSFMPNGIKIEVDFFEGRHEGLVIAEIEVPCADYELSKLPEWIDTEKEPEVTSNAKLAMMQ